MKHSPLHYIKESANFYRDKKCNKAQDILTSFTCKSKRLVLDTLLEHGTLNVTEIMIKTRKYYSEVCVAANYLEKVGLVTSQKDGKFVYYTLNKERLQRVVETASKLAQFWS